MKTESTEIRQYENTLVLANAIQLSSNVIRQVAGNEISDGVNGEQMSEVELSETLAAKLNSYLMNPTGGKV